jgi:hypothetical protein
MFEASRVDEVPEVAEPSSLVGDPMTLLWRGAGDRETGAEAIEALRARLQEEGPDTEEKDGRWRSRSKD